MAVTLLLGVQGACCRGAGPDPVKVGHQPHLLPLPRPRPRPRLGVAPRVAGERHEARGRAARELRSEACYHLQRCCRVLSADLGDGHGGDLGLAGLAAGEAGGRRQDGGRGDPVAVRRAGGGRGRGLGAGTQQLRPLHMVLVEGVMQDEVTWAAWCGWWCGSARRMVDTSST